MKFIRILSVSIFGLIFKTNLYADANTAEKREFNISFSSTNSLVSNKVAETCGLVRSFRNQNTLTSVDAQNILLKINQYVCPNEFNKEALLGDPHLGVRARVHVLGTLTVQLDDVRVLLAMDHFKVSDFDKTELDRIRNHLDGIQFILVKSGLEMSSP